MLPIPGYAGRTVFVGGAGCHTSRDARERKLRILSRRALLQRRIE